MPPASGIALGFDRLVMLATGARRIEQVIWSACGGAVDEQKEERPMNNATHTVAQLRASGLVTKERQAPLEKVADALRSRDSGRIGAADRP